ncbi:MAG: hypothetical protein SOW68_01310 [Eubacteriales bacterium]|nr:hypothetical protein [Eubacteriales bacterium]
MKRTIRLFALALALMLFASCSAAKTYPTDDVYHPETDSPYYIDPNPSPCKLVEAESGYYFRVGYTILFADKSTMEVMPLCSLPGCLHNAETDEAKRELCQARLPKTTSSPPLVYQNGALYTCYRKRMDSEEYTMVKISPDGTERRDVLTFPDTGDIVHFRVHRGKLYYITMSFSEKGGGRTVLWEKPLDRPREKPRELRSLERFAYSSVQDLIAYGNRLYLLEPVDEERYVLRIMDIRTREWTEIAPFEEDETFSGLWIFNGKLMLNCYTISDENTNVFTDDFQYAIYRCELDGSNPEKTGLSWGNWYADEEYAYLVDPYTGDRRDGSLRILDRDYQQVDELPFADWPIEGGTMVAVDVVTQNGGRQIVHIQEGEPHSMVLWYFDRPEIGSGQLQPKEFFRFDAHDYV